MSIMEAESSLDRSEQKVFWWQVEGHHRVLSAYKALDSSHNDRMQTYSQSLWEYDRSEVFSFRGDTTRKKGPFQETRWNGIKAVADTITARLAKRDHRASVATEGANAHKARAARSLQNWLDGTAHHLRIGEIGRQMKHDAVLLGTGIIGMGRMGSKFQATRVLPSNLRVNEQDSIDGKPRVIFETKFLDRGVAISMWPKKRKLLQKTAAKTAFEESSSGVMSDNAQIPGTESPADTIEVICAYRLADSDELANGVRAIVVENGLVEWEVYPYEIPPYVFLRKDSGQNFFGTGVGESLMPLQKTLTQTVQEMEAAFKLGSNPTNFFPQGCSVPTKKFTNIPGQQITFDPAIGKPFIETFSVVQADKIQWVENTYSKMFELEGVSFLSATGQVPSNVDSAKGMRELLDTETDRFAVLTKDVDQVHLDVMHWLIRLAKEMDADPTKGVSPPKAVAVHDTFTSEVEWKDIQLEGTDYVLTLHPAAMLPTHPGAKMATVTEMLTNGAIDVATWRRMMAFPDLEAEDRLMRAPDDLVDKLCDDWSQGKPYVGPEPEWDLDRMVPRVRKYLMLSAIQGVSDMAKDKMRQFMTDALEQQRKVEAKAELDLQAEMAAQEAEEMAAKAPPPPPPEMPAELPPGG